MKFYSPDQINEAATGEDIGSFPKPDEANPV